jgi:hypothetical protein
MSAHTPVRAVWTCAGRRDAWPCQTRRRQLMAEYAQAPASLSLFMNRCLANDLPDIPAGDLYARFLGWLMSDRVVSKWVDGWGRGGR